MFMVELIAHSDPSIRAPLKVCNAMPLTAPEALAA